MKRILISGGTRGIGRACAVRFAEAGWDVAVLYRTSDAQAQELKERFCVAPYRCDLADRTDLYRVLTQIKKEYSSGFDVLVNNAGTAMIAPLSSVGDEMWDKMTALSLTAPLLLARELSPYMIARGEGRIINISSVWGQTGASCEVPYSTVKAGLIGFTKALAKALAPSNVLVNCVCPGVIDTEMNAAITPECKDDLCAEIALGRFGTAEEVAECVFWLAGNASSYFTGQILAPNGGFYI